MRVHLVIDDPFGEVVPFIARAPVYTNAPFTVLIFTLLQIGDEFYVHVILVGEDGRKCPRTLCELSEIPSFDIIIRLQEYFSKS